MATYPSKSAPYEEGLELNRDDEGLQWRTGGATKQPGLEYKDEPDHTPYRQVNGSRNMTNDTTQRRNPWGLGPLMFGLLVAAVTALVVGAAVGGGMSGAINAAHYSSM
jgi:hypothetical protein